MPPAASSANGYDADADLARVAQLAARLRALEADTEQLRDERREVIQRLRDHEVTVRRIAEAMNVTEGAVQATLRVKRT